MRSVIPVAFLVLTSFVLAGCAKDGGGEDDLHYVCSNGTEIHGEDHPEVNATKAQDLARFCPGGSTTTGSRSNTTSAAPNVPPVLDVKITDAGGNVTSVTMLDGNLTFDASNSTDSDGTIAGIAVTVTDSNTTRTATLYDAAKKQFKPATFTFDRPGVVNVTIAMVDDRAGFTVNQTHVYVNHLQFPTPQAIPLPGGNELPQGGADCQAEALHTAQYYKAFSFILHAGATFVEAQTTDASHEAVLTICSPTHDPLSDPGDPVVTNEDAVLTAPTSTDSYYIGAYSAPEAASPQTPVAVQVLVHYEPRAAAPA